MIKDCGEMPPENFNDANVPVDIWLSKLDPESESDKESYGEGFRYRLTTGVYMPRKASVWSEACTILSDNKEELQKIVEKYILPFYKLAVSKIQGIIEGTEDHLYYWE